MITTSDLLKTLGNFAGTNEIGGIIVLEMERSQFAISEISRIVESNDATHSSPEYHRTRRNRPADGNHTHKQKEIAAIVATFEQYEYDVIYLFWQRKFRKRDPQQLPPPDELPDI